MHLIDFSKIWNINVFKTVFAHQISEIAHYVLLNNVGKFLLTEKSVYHSFKILIDKWLLLLRY